MPRGRTRILQVEMVPNAFMAAPPRHPFVAFAIHRLNASRDRMFKKRPHPSAATGPVFLTSSVAEWHALKLGGLHAYDYPIVYNSRFGVKHWCSWAANFPETLTVNDARAQFERCAERRLDCVFTSFWTSSWVTQKVKVTRINSSLMSLSPISHDSEPAAHAVADSRLADACRGDRKLARASTGNESLEDRAGNPNKCTNGRQMRSVERRSVGVNV